MTINRRQVLYWLAGGGTILLSTQWGQAAHDPKTPADLIKRRLTWLNLETPDECIGRYATDFEMHYLEEYHGLQWELTGPAESRGYYADFFLSRFVLSTDYLFAISEASEESANAQTRYVMLYHPYLHSGWNPLFDYAQTRWRG